MSLAVAASHDREHWSAIAAAVRPRLETRLFIDGGYVDALQGGRFTTTNPATGAPLAEISAGTQADIDRAVAAALRAFRAGVWSRIPPRQRMEIMYRFAALVDEHAEELAVLESLDVGKPIADVVASDLPAVIETIRFMAECIDKVEGAVTNTESGVVHMILREPLGVVGAISPWNYPLLMAVWKIAPALAAGNTVVLKPAEEAPLSCLRLAALFMEAGGPAGVLNVVNGLGEVAGKALALHSDVAKISFTGSTEVGKLILQYAGQSNMKRVALECGGKSPQVFMADVPDLDRAVTAAYRGIFSNMGEVCNAGSRLLVHRDIHDAFVDQLSHAVRALRVGNPMDESTQVGPLVDRDGLRKVQAHVTDAVSKGAQVCVGGRALEGLYFEPTVLDGIADGMTIFGEETFGPVAPVLAFRDEAEAVRSANATPFGLAAYLWTRDLGRAFRVAEALDYGIIGVNDGLPSTPQAPFGGVKQSGIGREGGRWGLDEYLDVKYVSMVLPEGPGA